MANLTRLPKAGVAEGVKAFVRAHASKDAFVAAARRIATTKMTRSKTTSAAAEAWDLRDLVGEVRFITNTVASKGSRAKLFVAKVPANQEDDPVPLKSGPAYEAWRQFTTNSDMRELIKRALNNYQVTGEGYLAGIPGGLLGADTDETQWHFLSKSEVKKDYPANGEVELKVLGAKVETYLSSITLIETWNPHPADSARPDSPVLSAMPILREIVGLTMHVSAQVDSRLAGAGVFVVPQSALMAITSEDEGDEGDDPFTAALLTAMDTAISDRSSAAALTPIVITVPDEATGKFEHLKFWSELDAEARPLREEGLRRLALAMDCPPDLLLGQQDMNHWGAWVSREETVQSHIEPLLDLLVRAISQEYLWSALIDFYDMSPEEAHKYVVYYSTKHLISRSNRTQDALNLHQRGVISDESLRNTADFDEKDAPPVLVSDPATKIALDLIKASPGLASAPGLIQLTIDIQTVLDAGGNVDDLGRSLTPDEEAVKDDGLPEQPAEGLPPGDGGTRESESDQ
jgi:hypothetical protein